MESTQFTDDQVLFERDIQLFIAKNLHVLGPNLTLIGTEHEVPFGRIDVLAVDPDFNHTVVEVKRGIASRDAIGQLQSYMGAIKRTFPESRVKGVLVALALDAGADAALEAAVNIRFVKYELRFHFEEVKSAPDVNHAGGGNMSIASIWSTAPSGEKSNLSSPTRLRVNDAWPK